VHTLALSVLLELEEMLPGESAFFHRFPQNLQSAKTQATNEVISNLMAISEDNCTPVSSPCQVSPRKCLELISKRIVGDASLLNSKDTDREVTETMTVMAGINEALLAIS
jgi:hypothetical protein